jgi:hypothetical protein
MGSGRVFSPRHRVQTGSEAHPASYQMDTRGSFPWDKEAKGVNLTTRLNVSAEIENAWCYTSIPPILS